MALILQAIETGNSFITWIQEEYIHLGGENGRPRLRLEEVMVDGGISIPTEETQEIVSQ